MHHIAGELKHQLTILIRIITHTFKNKKTCNGPFFKENFGETTSILKYLEFVELQTFNQGWFMIYILFIFSKIIK